MTKFQKTNSARRPIHPISVWVLKIGLALVSLQLLALAVAVGESFHMDPLYTCRYFAPALEYVALSLTLIVGGALLFDASTKEK